MRFQSGERLAGPAERACRKLTITRMRHEHDDDHAAAAGSIKEPQIAARASASTFWPVGANRQSSYESPVAEESGLGGTAVRQARRSSRRLRRTAPPLTPSPKVSEVAFRYALQEADQQVQDGKYKAALATLTLIYGSTDLTPEEPPN